MVAAKDHPDYRKFLQDAQEMGLPKGAALQKMTPDWMDQAILDTPEEIRRSNTELVFCGCG